MINRNSWRRNVWTQRSRRRIGAPPDRQRRNRVGMRRRNRHSPSSEIRGPSPKSELDQSADARFGGESYRLVGVRGTEIVLPIGVKGVRDPLPPPPPSDKFSKKLCNKNAIKSKIGGHRMHFLLTKTRYQASKWGLLIKNVLRYFNEKW